MELYELGPALGVLEEGDGSGTPNFRQLREQKPTFSFGGHPEEGFALDWSPTVPGKGGGCVGCGGIWGAPLGGGGMWGARAPWGGYGALEVVVGLCGVAVGL